MDVDLHEATDGDRAVVRRLLQLYHYDFSEFDGSDVDAHGEYVHRYFDEYWNDADRQAYLFRVAGAWAGLALVYTGLPHDMAEFFVMRKYRRRRIGSAAAQLLFRRVPGAWTVRQTIDNPTATAFWRSAIPYPFSETEQNGELTQSFTSSGS